MAGLPIVFIPGLLTTGRIYQHQADHLGRAHPVLLADHWTGASMGEIADGILALAPPTFALVGTSMGGYVAFEILRRAPERVARLALLSTTAHPDAPDRSAQRRQQLAWTREHGVRAGTRGLWNILVHPARREDRPLLTMFLEMAEELGIDAFARQTEAIIARADSRPLLPQIKVPTLVIAGADDHLLPPSNSVEIAAAIPGAHLETIAHCGHMGVVEMPETYTKLLGDFLA